MIRVVFAVLLLGMLGAVPARGTERPESWDLGMKVKVRMPNGEVEEVCMCPTNAGNCFCTPKGMVDKEKGR